MLLSELIHPQIMAALAAAGHTAAVLIADANYPITTAVRPGATIVHIGLRAGMPSIDDVLTTIITAVPIESAAYMNQDDGQPPQVLDEHRKALPNAKFVGLGRQEFYAQARSDDLALAVATGDIRPFANILLTIGERHT